MAMKIYFHELNVEYHPTCDYDYLKITNDNSETFGVICGYRYDTDIIVTGRYALLTFHSDSEVQNKGFNISFTAVPKPELKDCGSVVNNTLTSPGYPDNYPSDMDCNYSVPIPQGMAIKITFHEFDVEYDSSCNFDYLKITNENGEPFGVFCGKQYGMDVIVIGNYALLTFHSDSNVQGRGFVLSFTVAPKSEVCGSVVNNTLTSPRYPDKYPRNMDCNYSVPIPQGMALKIDFHEFDVEYESKCRFDYLVITNDNNKAFGVICGQRGGAVVNVTGNYTLLTFHSDAEIENTGFLLSFTTFPLPEAKECGSVVNNTLTSPGYPNNYPSNMDCNYSVPIPPGMAVKITFYEFDVEYDVSCKYDYLEITNEKGKVFGTLCGGPYVDVNIEVNVTGNYARLIFHSDADLEKRGFLLRCTVVPPPDCGRMINNTLTSPGYPNNYPNNIYCIYSVPIPPGMAMKITFQDFDLEYDSSLPLLCPYDYLTIKNERKDSFAFLCGEQPGKEFTVIGEYALLAFSSDVEIQARGFNLVFTFLDCGSQCSFERDRDDYAYKLSCWNVTSFVDIIKCFPSFVPNLYLESNNIQNLPKDVFFNLSSLISLYLSSNNIQNLTAHVFSHLKTLGALNLASNTIQSLHEDAFVNLASLITLDLSSNNIQNLQADVFAPLRSLETLELSSNNIQNLSADVFSSLKSLQNLYLSFNRIEILPAGVFLNLTSLIDLYLDSNKIHTLSADEFFNLTSLRELMVNDNPIKTIEPEAFRLELLFTRITSVNPENSEEEAIKVKDPKGLKEPFVSVLLTSGFRQIAGNDSVAYFLPCPVGTFTNSSSDGKQVCTACPPGGFYSDDVGHVAPSCKKCPNGSYVHIDKAPGTQSQDCKSCPRGTETDFFAGYRACKCLEGFYRKHMFEQCYKCVGGLQCTDDYASLKPGYWWKWRSLTHKDRYRAFIKNLQSPLPALSADDIRYSYPIPTPFQCPKEESCVGGLDSPCNTGYEGPLCAVCSSGYHEKLQTCKQCPSKKWIVGQLSIVATILLIIIAILAWARKRNTKNDDKHSVIDVFLSKVKIVIGFYQVTYGLLETFSYIKWPDSLQAIGKHSEVLQMNVLHIAPIHCLYAALQVDAFGNLFVMMATNAAVICLSVVGYGISKLIVSRNGRVKDEEKTIKLSQTKEFLYRNVFFFLYTTYLRTCSMTANVMPLVCRKICRDEDEELCNKYLKADYSIQCQGPKYNHLLILAYLSAAYVIAIPVASFIALWRQRRVILAAEDEETSEDSGPNTEIIAGLRFLFENYKPCSWYWELVEMSRKVILTSGLILVGEESRSYIGLTLVIAGMYGMVFSWMKPIQDGFENKMMTISLAVTVFNLAIGAVSRIPAENVSSSSEPYVEAFVFKMLVLGANSLVIGLLAVQYLVGVYRYFKEWRKNPHWSFSCCLALLLPLNDLRGEISGLAETNVFKSQLKSGEMEMPTIMIAVEDSNDNLHAEGGDQHDKQDKQGYDDKMVTQENSLPNAKSIKRCNQGIQTEFFKLSLAANVVVCGPTGKK
ncbi:uncharacterized protein LOC144667259 [Oculina patagonica]